MKKRVFIIMAACMFLMGCGRATVNQSPLPSVEAGVNEGGASEDGTAGGDANSTEGNSDMSDADSSMTEGGADDYNSDGSSYTGGDDGVASGVGSNGSDSDRDFDEPDVPAGSANSPALNSGSNSGAGNESAYTSDSSDNTPDTSDSDDIGGGADENDSNNDSESADDNSGSGDNNDNSGDNSGDQASGYGRIFFIGDSRTVDMFDGGAEEIYDYNAGGIRVFAKDGCHCAYMQDVTGKYAGEFDTVVSWLGCNDNNDAALYQQVYEYLMSQGKTVVLCTVGPTADASLSGDFDVANYPNEKMVAFNQSMVSWASSHGVKVIDTYSFVQGNVEISGDGIHYNPKPTTAIWNYIMSNL